MATADLNAFIAGSWPILKAQLAADLQTSVSAWELKSGDSASLHLSNALVNVIALGAPGLVSSTPAGPNQTLQIRFPAEGDASLKITGKLEGDTTVPLVGAVNPTDVDINISNLSTTAIAIIDSSTPDAPILKKLSLSPVLQVSSNLLNFNLPAGQWTPSANAPHSGAIQADVKIHTSTLFPHLGNIEIDGTIYLDVLATPWLKVEINILNLTKVPITLSSNLPADLQILVDLVRAAGTPGSAATIPRSWGIPPAGFIEPPVDQSHWPSDINFPTAASDIQASSSSKHLLDGVAFNNIYSWDAATLKFTLKSYDDGRDCAIWTGHLLSAQAFRYAAAVKSGIVAAQHAAIDDANAVLNGIEKLFVVPETAVGNTNPSHPLVPTTVNGLMCRSVIATSRIPSAVPAFNAPGKNDKGEDLTGNYYTDPIKLSDGSLWYAFGRDNDEPSRDQLIGVITGLGWAGVHFTGNAAILGRVKPLLKSVVDYLLNNEWGFPSPSGKIDSVGQTTKFRTVTTFISEFHQQLAILKIAAVVLGDKYYKDAYELAWKAISDWTWVSVWIDTFDPIVEYFKFNLDWNCIGILLYLESDDAHRAPLLQALDILRKATGHHRNAFFNLMYIAALTPPERPAALTGSDGFNGALTLQNETKGLLLEWLQRRTQVWGPNMLPTQATAVVAYNWLGETFTSGPYRPLLQIYETSDGKSRFAATYAMPVMMRPGGGMDFLWQRDPFSTSLEPDASNGLAPSWGDREKEGPGIDFLLPYWMAAFLDVV